MMNIHLRKDLTQLSKLFDLIKSQSLDYLRHIDQRPTSSQSKVVGHMEMPDEGIGAEATLALFNERFEKLIVGSSGPRYWGYVTGGTTPAAIMGDWLASVYDQNPQTLSGVGDISGAIEAETIKLLLDLFNLPYDFIGGFVTGATMSNFTCLAVARQWWGKLRGKDFAKEGISETIPILSASPHSSVVKTLALLGIGSQNIIMVAQQEHRESISVQDLEDKIGALNGSPFILLSSGGTVNRVDYDDYTAIKSLHQKHRFWWHIDAAFGGFAAVSKKYRHLVADWEYADSITVDCHKWLNVPYESAVCFIKKSHRMCQVESFQNSDAPYLGDPLAQFNYLNFLPENSRRLKALPAWFTLMAYGRQGYAAIVDQCAALALYFGQQLKDSDRFELLAPVTLNNLIFSLKDQNKDPALFLLHLNQTNQVFMTPTIYQGRQSIRASFVNWRTTRDDVDLVMRVMQGVS